jgi:hypothetical protein
MPFDLCTETDPKLLKQLRKVLGYELVVVDTPLALRSDALLSVVQAADYLITAHTTRTDGLNGIDRDGATGFTSFPCCPPRTPN